MKQAKWIYGKLDRAAGILSSIICGVLGQVSLMFVAVVITVHTVDRKFIGVLNWVFVDEWSGYLWILMLYLSWTLTLRSKEGHLKILIMSRYIGQKAWSVLEVVMLLPGLPVLGFCLYSSIRHTLHLYESGQRSLTILMTPLWIPNAFIVLGLSVFTFVLAVYSMGKVINLATGIEERADVGAVDSNG